MTENLATELEAQQEQQNRREQIAKAYRENPRSVLTAADEIEELDRRTADKIAEVLIEAHSERIRLENKLGNQRQRLQLVLQRHLNDNEIDDLDRLPRGASRDPKAYAAALVNRVLPNALNRSRGDDDGGA